MSGAAENEGFICPVCMWVGQDGPDLANHFETEHEEARSGSLKAGQNALSHGNLSLSTFKAPDFGYQAECKICKCEFTFSKTRHHCRNCGNAACGSHSRNSMALPHLGFWQPVRVCDACFEDLHSERQASQGVVKSGRLVRSDKQGVFLVRLSHLALSFFGCNEEGSGKLLNTFHLSDVISMRLSSSNKSLFAVGDTSGNTLMLQAADEADACAWLEAIMRTKNELLDAVKQLDLSSREPQVLVVSARDEASLGPLEVCVSRNVGFRAPFRLPLMTAHHNSAVLVQLSAGCVQLTGPELRKASDSGSNVWMRASRDVGTSTSSRRLALEMHIQTESIVPLGVAHALSMWSWLRRAPSADFTASLPIAASYLSTFFSSPLHPAYIFGAIALVLLTVSSSRCGRPGVSATVEIIVTTGIGVLCVLASIVAAARGNDLREPVYRYRVTLVSFSWDDSSIDKRNAETKPPACPERFLRMVRGDSELALQSWAKTKLWRAQVTPERLLTHRPRPSYGDIKQDIQHYFHKRDRNGRVVYYEVLNAPQACFRALKVKGWGVDDVIEHMMFINEFMYREVLRDYDDEGSVATPTGQMIKVMDVASLGMSDVGGDVSAYFNKIGVMGKHYPERLDKILVINVPASFSMVWNIVAPMLDRNVRERISIYRANYHEALFELIDPNNVPLQYGGTCQCEGGCRHHSPEETLLRQRVDALNEMAEANDSDTLIL